MSAVAFIRRCLAVGMDLETALVAAEQFEATAQPMVPTLTARQARNQRYEAKKRLEASETSESKTPKTVSDAFKTDQTVSDASRTGAQVVIPSLPSLRSEELVVGGGGVGRERVPETDDWPEGRASDHAEQLVAIVASPWLDPCKSPDLVTTRGRVAVWKRDGASWEHDVLPVVTGLCANRRARISSWKFFDAAVARSIAENRQALEIPESSGVVPIRGTGPPNFADQAAAVIAEARRRVLES